MGCIGSKQEQQHNDKFGLNATLVDADACQAAHGSFGRSPLPCSLALKAAFASSVSYSIQSLHGSRRVSADGGGGCTSHSDATSVSEHDSGAQFDQNLIRIMQSRLKSDSSSTAAATAALSRKASDVVALSSRTSDVAALSTKNSDVASLAGQPHDVMAYGAPLPPNEANRAESLFCLHLLTASPCVELDVILSALNKVSGLPVAVVALYGGSDCMYISNATPGTMPLGRYAWKDSLCPWTLARPKPEVVVIEDLSEDARFSRHSLTASGVRTCASCPIIASDGHCVGTVCVADTKVTRLDMGCCRLLSNFAEMATRELERYTQVEQRLKSNQDNLRDAFESSNRPFKRNLASANNSCLVVIDVTNGFEVLYATQSWADWVKGFKRDDAMGRRLPFLVESATPDVPIVWNQIASEAVGGARFVIPRLRARGSADDPDAVVFDISFRCGAVEALDNDTLPIAIPTFVQLSTAMTGIYFGRLHVVRHHAFAPLQAKGQASPNSMSPHDMAAAVIPGLKMGQGLGRGGFGTAFVADYHGTQVVCKVQDHILHNDHQRANAESEIALGQNLDHPNIVRILAHGTVQLSRHLPSDLVGALQPATAMDMLDYYVDDMDEFDWGDDIEDDSVMPMISCVDLDVEPPEVFTRRGSQVLVGRRAESSTMRDSVVSGSRDTLELQYSRTCTSVANGGGSTICDEHDDHRLFGDSGRMDFAAGGSSSTPWAGLPARGERSVTMVDAIELRASADAAGSTAGRSGTVTPPGGEASCSYSTAGGHGGGNGGGHGRLSRALAPSSNNSSSVGPKAFPDAAVLDRERTKYWRGEAAEEAAVSVDENWAGAGESDVGSGDAGQYPVELRVFVVMELCDKGCLQEAIDRGWLREKRDPLSGPSPGMVLRTALDIAQAVEYVHSRFVVHGDLTGYNVLLKSIPGEGKLLGKPTLDAYRRPFVVKIADFGTSRRLQSAEDYMRTDAYATFTHMPPEMLTDNHMSLACDVWAFGVLLWSMWTGSRPWAGLSHEQTKAVVVDNTASLQFPEGTPECISSLGARCMAYIADDRPCFSKICRELKRMMAELCPEVVLGGSDGTLCSESAPATP